MKKYIGIVLVLLVLVCVVYAVVDDEYATLTRQTDNRKNVNYPVWDALITATYDADDTDDVTQALIINGVIQKIIFHVPTFTNGGETAQILIRDNEDRTIFDSGEQPDAATYAWSVHEPVTGTIDIVIGISGVTGSAAAIIATLRGI
jgi:hypothetical protein